MDSNKVEVISNITIDMHDDITNIYEAAADNENQLAIKTIDSLRTKLNALKSNLLTKENEI